MEYAEDFKDLVLPHPKDGKVLTAAFNALLNESANVFIVGEEEFHIDACFMAFYGTLKKYEDFILHRMMSPKVEDTVELFNSILSNLTIEQARNEQAEQRHVIIMPEVGPSAGKEWMACEALVNTFPGANVVMVAFSTVESQDIATVRQVGLKSNNRLFNLGGLDLETMTSYLNECKTRGSLQELMPSLENTIWHPIALEIAGESPPDGPVTHSVADYKESIDSSEAGDEQNERAGSIEELSRNPIEDEASGYSRWRGWLEVSKSIISATLIAIIALIWIVVVAGALEPSLWKDLNALLQLLIEQTERLFER